MACGDIAWWRSPDLVGLLTRHGQAEHLLVQFDFMRQVARDGRAEFSIPGASKTLVGQTGFADIVSVANREIWEVKSGNGDNEKLAVNESRAYVSKAQASCGPDWSQGTSYNSLDGTGVVYSLEGENIKAELVAEQAAAGAVLYHWRINGLKVKALDPFVALSLRMAVIQQFFGSEKAMQPLAGAQAPGNIPPPRWKPPVLQPGGLIAPVLTRYAGAILNAIRQTCCTYVAEGGGVAMLVDREFYDALVTQPQMQQTVQRLQVSTDPTLTLYRIALALGALAGASQGALIAAVGGAWLIKTAAVAAGAVVVELQLGAGIAARASGSLSGVAASLASTLQANLQLRTAVSAGATCLAFVIPRVSQGAPADPDAARTLMPKFRILSVPEVSQATIGQTMNVDGADWYVIAVAVAAPG